jgi:LysM repeat protein
MNSAEEYDDYGPEPNMKLSHAFLVVLLLHVIAVGGLYAFNSMKAGKVSAGKVARNIPSAPVESTQEPQGNENNQKSGGGSGEKPPTETKAPLVAKVAEAPKATKPSASSVKNSANASSQDASGKGLLASARGVLQKAAGIGAAAAGASKASAQSPSPDTQGSATATESNPQVTSTNKTYMVRTGDTMTRIASSLGVAIPDLEKINGMTEKSVIQVGQILKVPEKAIAQAAAGVASGAGKMAEGAAKIPGEVSSAMSGATSASASISNAPVADVTGGPTTDYTVVKGDSPYKIAKKFKITPNELMKANGITDPKKIQIGQQLKIPASTAKKGK